MLIAKSKLSTDAKGIWCEQASGMQYGILWREIERVSAYKLRALDETYTCVELAFSTGEFIELYADWAGFDEVVGAMTERLAGLRAGWFQGIEQLDVQAGAVQVWHR
jgi:hypothetical protein